MRAPILLSVIATVLFAISAPDIKTIIAKKGEVTASKEYLAVTSFAENKTCQVSARFSGFIENIYADERYKNVQKGDTLFDAYSPEVVSSINEAISIKKYITSLKNSNDQASLEDAKKMLDASIQRLSYLGLTAGQIDSELSHSEASRTIKFKSPCSGTVSEKEIFKGSAFNTGQKLYSIVDNSSLWLEIKIYENDLQNVHVGQSVEASVAGVDKKIKAKIIKILPEISPKDRSITARALIQNPSGRLAANSFAKAVIFSNKVTGILLPKSAVLERSGKFFVFINQNGKFEPLEVNAKKIGSNYIITDGISEGDKVAKGALFMLDSDAKLQGQY